MRVASALQVERVGIQHLFDATPPRPTDVGAVHVDEFQSLPHVPEQTQNIYRAARCTQSAAYDG